MLKRLALAGWLALAGALAAVPAQATGCNLTAAYPFKDGTATPQNFAATVTNPSDNANPCRVVPHNTLVDQTDAPIGTPGNPIATTSPSPAAFFTKRIVMTGSPLQLPANALANGLTLTADAANASPIYYGPSSASVTTIDGTGDAYPIQAGGSAVEALSNSNLVWANGVAGTILRVKGD